MIYAAYGSNLNKEQMKNRCPKAKVIGTGVLRDYQLCFRGGSRGIADVQDAAGKMVPILLWDISEDCEKSLDFYEGYPRLYRKEDVTVYNEDGQKVKAMLYKLNSPYYEMFAVPEKNYFNIILEAYTELGFQHEVVMEALQEVCDLSFKRD